ncbi:MAG: hypothetical protein UH853_04645 [Muribaculaceae bacterium]|jgi:hypothetical protein|nr:hypothetical protein [Muribaculaceae bacterium]
MKRLFLLLFIASFALYSHADEYSVEAIYEKVDVKRGTIAVDNYGTPREVDYLLVKTSLKSGKYQIELTRKDSNLYHVCGTDYYIKTRYCYEYATYDDAILVVDYYSTKVIFLE